MSCADGKGPPAGGPCFFIARTACLLRRWQLRRLRHFSGPGCRLLLTLLENERIALAGHLAKRIHHGAGPGRDQPTHDDVLLEAFEGVDLAVDRGLREHTRRLL